MSEIVQAEPVDAPPTPIAPKPKRRVPLWALIATGVGALIIGALSGGASASTARDDLAAAQDRVSELESEVAGWEQREADLAAREDDVAGREEAVTATETQIQENTIPGSGVYLVGADIQPGTYRSEANSGCYWARLSGTSGNFDDIIANDNVDGQAVVTIQPSDVAFETNRCQDWVKVG